jgi:hypothetical protein
MYQFTLEGKGVKRNQVTGMHLMAGLLLLVMGLLTWLVPDAVKQTEFSFLNWAGLLIAFTGAIIIFLSIFYNKKLIQSNFNFVLRLIEIVAMGAILIYSLLKEWYLPAAYSAAATLGILLAYYWEKTEKKDQVLVCDDNGISIDAKHRFSWQEIQNLRLRHNILTIDCHNNKLYQYKLTGNYQQTDRETFESYCSIQIQAKKHLKQKEW